MGDSVFSFLFLSCSWRMFLVFLALGGPWGEGVSGHLTITAQAGSGQEKVILEKPAAAEATAVGFFGIHILSQTGLACHSRAPPYLLHLRQYVGLAGIRTHDLPV